MIFKLDYCTMKCFILSRMMFLLHIKSLKMLKPQIIETFSLYLLNRYCIFAHFANNMLIPILLQHNVEICSFECFLFLTLIFGNCYGAKITLPLCWKCNSVRLNYQRELLLLKSQSIQGNFKWFDGSSSLIQI